MTSGLKAKAALSERGDDLYETSAEAVAALLERETLPPVVWEPACGPGAIVGVLRAKGHTVIATDLNDWGCPDSESRRDFRVEQRAPDGCGCIITNPPYKLAQEFVLKARELVPKVVMLLRLAFLESECRRNILEPGDLARVFVFRNRLPMMHRFGWTGPRASSATAYAWFAWDRAHRDAESRTSRMSRHTRNKTLLFLSPAPGLNPRPKKSPAKVPLKQKPCFFAPGGRGQKNPR